MSGGVTALGTLAEAAGAVIVALTARAFGMRPCRIVATAGLCGAFLDSFLGATLQSLRHCDRCNVHCETNPHRCGTPTREVRGATWLQNDAVNALATLFGALVAYALRSAI